MRLVGIIITLIVVLIGIVFAALNAKSVEINYLIDTRSLPLAVILLMAMVVGMLICLLILGPTLIKLKIKNSWLENKLKQSHDELTKIQH